MKAVAASDAVLDRPRHAAAVVEDPRIVVVESPGTADPGAVHAALELLVKWAVRTHKGLKPAMEGAQTVADFADGDAGDST